MSYEFAVLNAIISDVWLLLLQKDPLPLLSPGSTLCQLLAAQHGPSEAEEGCRQSAPAESDGRRVSVAAARTGEEDPHEAEVGPLVDVLYVPRVPGAALPAVVDIICGRGGEALFSEQCTRTHA